MSWAVVTLDDLKADEPRAITDGPFGSHLASRHYTAEGPRVVRLQNIGDGKFIDERAHISQTHFESLRAHEVQAGDLLVASLGEVLPRACLAPASLGQAIVKADCIRVRLTPEVDPRWVLYALQRPEVRRWADAHRHGVGRPRLGLKVIRSIPVPLAPLDEQRRIVDLLEDHLSRLDAADTYLESATQQAESLRWRAAAIAVAAAGGRKIRLGEIATVRNGIFVSRPGVEPNGVPILRIGAVRPMSLDLTDLRFSERTEADLLSADALVTAGDLLFTRYNGNPRYVGACVSVPSDAPILTYPDKLIRVRVTDNHVLPAFVALACSVGSARAQIQASVRTTAGQAGISGRDLKSVTLCLPDLDSQHTAVAAYKDARDATVRLSHELETARHRGAALRRSLLAAAFAGRLKPTPVYS
ncbi:restriction endonuclease S subunits-like protein [Mycobacteroides abscessus subsp. abscessus]|nr:restriction endonuclease S subunits-like protein [Mycobacteroides abscessus subsp. abscessus]SKJ84521.1 restriction endonuclease S subunits-like protein [Mycobacteroides abscessus subsp. bolletii]SHW39399.1 restriction endonuclease S subunits-like protein [Mycobacteroides abscessus subsp. abscessus]SIF85238.1 restriction endonuclease S subunits-like protein [Mycobacteroides abscessus subsp. abscessus]SKD17537.1 restriction endonuclease S subunits-like protein [Mycobacteroides abscessus subsp